MPRVLVLFVHGFDSSPQIWDSLLELCRADPELSELAHFECFDYSMSTTATPGIAPAATSLATKGGNTKVKAAPSIETIANNLGKKLATVWKRYREIALVGHSTGGLVARIAILNETKLLRTRTERRCRKVVLLAVPNNGTHLASLGAALLRGNEQLEELSINSKFIKTLNTDWDTLDPLGRDCEAYFVGDRDHIVPWESACARPGIRHVYPILGKDHNTIYLVTSPGDDCFAFLKDFLLEEAEDRERVGAVAANPALQPVPPLDPSTGAAVQAAAAPLPTAAADPAEFESRAAGIPGDEQALLGRERELAELRELLLGAAPKRLVTLTADGGYGKSHLARELARQVRGEYADGVGYVRLDALEVNRNPAETDEEYAARVSERIAGETLEALGQQLSAAKPTVQLLGYLCDKRMLVYFDNFEQVTAGKGLLTQILDAAPGAQLLVTSRRHLELSREKLYRLEPLAHAVHSPSVALFAEHAQRSAADFVLDEATRDKVAAICAELEGVPLAIILVAARADVVSLDDMQAQLGSILRESLEHDDVPERQRSLAASNEWSWRWLTEQQQRCLLRLGVFRGSWFAAAAQVVLGIEATACLGLLRELLHRNWLKEWNVDLKHDGVHKRFDFRNRALEQFVQGKLQEEERADLKHAAELAQASYFATHSGQQYGQLTAGRQKEALAWFGVERANLLTAFETALHRHDRALLNRLEAGLGLYLDRIASYSLELELLGRAAACKQSIQDEHGAAQSFSNIANIYVKQGEYSRAGALHGQVLDVMRREKDEHGVAISLGNIAIVYRRQGDYARALELFEESLAVKRRLEDELGAAQTLGSMAGVYLEQKNYGRALELYEQSLAVMRDLGNEHGVAQLQGNMAGVYQQQGNYTRALELYEQSLAVMLHQGDEHAVARALGDIAIVYKQQKDYIRALELYEQSLATKRRLGDQHGCANTQSNLGIVFDILKRNAEARAAWTEAEQLYRQLGIQAEADKLAQWLRELPEA